MKVVVVFLLVLGIVFIGYHAYQFWTKKVAIEEKFSDLQGKLNNLEAENKKIQGDLNYYSNEANLIKELRSQLNFHLPDEKTIIVVPKPN